MTFRGTLVCLCLLFLTGWSFAQEIKSLQSGKNTSIRGLSVVDNSVAWASGSNGYVANTKNGGKTWIWKQLPGYEKFDFRDIEAFSAQEAIIMSAGSPAVILKTTDGGLSWEEVYRNESPDIFLDGMDFWDRRRGIVYGDPIKGQMQLLRTKDGGKSWEDISANLQESLADGEASFAASGTAIRTASKGQVWIATGGSKSRIFFSDDYAKSWNFFPIPILQGNNSSGPFSIAFLDTQTGIAAGGDYLKDTLRRNNLVLTRDGGFSWFEPDVHPFGYRSAVEYLNKNVVIATGTSGTDISYDGGKTWKNISKEGFNAVRKAKQGNWVLLAGSKGRISVFRINKE